MKWSSMLVVGVLVLVAVGSGVGGATIIFQDDFNDGVLDSNKWFKGVSLEDPPWSPVGNYVSESGGAVTIAQATTNHGGRLISAEIPVNPIGTVTVERRTKVHHTNDKFRAYQYIRTDDYSLWSGPYFSRINYYDYDRGTYAYYGFGTHSDATNFDPIWDAWFDEVWTYNPVTNETTYSINGAPALSWTSGVGIVWGSTIRLDYCAEGWYSGHYIMIDDLVVTQVVPEPAMIGLLGLGTLALRRKRR